MLQYARAIESIFVTTWDYYLNQVTKNDISLALKKKAKETLQMKQTEDATLLVDEELPADRKTLSKLIRDEATSIAQSMFKREMEKHAKNKQRGPPGKSASEKKKKV